jgi:hypothetical protein
LKNNDEIWFDGRNERNIIKFGNKKIKNSLVSDFFDFLLPILLYVETELPNSVVKNIFHPKMTFHFTRGTIMLSKYPNHHKSNSDQGSYLLENKYTDKNLANEEHWKFGWTFYQAQEMRFMRFIESFVWDLTKIR